MVLIRGLCSILAIEARTSAEHATTNYVTQSSHQLQVLNAHLTPIKEDRALLPGFDGRPADV